MLSSFEQIALLLFLVVLFNQSAMVSAFLLPTCGGCRTVSNAIEVSSLQKQTQLASMNENSDFRRYNYLHAMVERKKIEVDDLLRRHTAVDDPLLMRLTYLNNKASFNLTHSIKRPYLGKDELVQMSVMVDVKRRSPTVPSQREIVDFGRADTFTTLLATIGVDAFFINTDDMEYGGQLEDLTLAVAAMKKFRPEKPPAIVKKDIFIHPIQVS